MREREIERPIFKVILTFKEGNVNIINETTILGGGVVFSYISEGGLL